MKKKEPAIGHEKVRRAALDLIDEQGLEGFSTRKLGAVLGCEAMAIYWYYPSKDALFDAVVDELMSRISIARTHDWVQALRGVARSYRNLAHRHPNAFPLVATRRFATSSSFEFLERLFEIAHARGIDDRTIARYYRAVSSFCSGFALNEIASKREGEADLPRVRAVSKWLAPKHHDDLFEFGLGVLLDSLANEID